VEVSVWLFATHAKKFPAGIDTPQGFTRCVSKFAAVPPEVSATSLVSENAAGALTVRVAEPMPLLYAPPLQLSENVSVPTAVGVTVWEPDAASVPLQPPLAVQLVPTFEDHVTTADWPSVIVAGATLTLTVDPGFDIDPPPPPYPPPQLAAIKAQRIIVTRVTAVRCNCTGVSLKRK
jgi:hypothetical protein